MKRIKLSPAWTGSVILTALLLCITLAFCQEGRKNVVTFNKYTIYEVGKNVADFKDGDVSTPEAFYATYNKVMASRDKDVVAKLYKYHDDQKLIPQSSIDQIASMQEDWAKILKTADILKVFIYNGQVAYAIAKLGGENTRNPYDIRALRKIDGKWLNVGNDRVDSPDVALLKFSQWAAIEAKNSAEMPVAEVRRNEEKIVDPAEVQRVKDLVEKFFSQNFRDYTARKTVSWNDPRKNVDDGSVSIVYRCEATIWDKDIILDERRFVFDKEENVQSWDHTEGFPQPIGKVEQKPQDVSTREAVQKLVEKFFTQNFRDITARQTVSWGELEKLADGSVALVYHYEATIWDKDKILDERRFVFDKNGEYKSCEQTKGFPKPQ
jgi:hypothetical protein